MRCELIENKTNLETWVKKIQSTCQIKGGSCDTIARHGWKNKKLIGKINVAVCLVLIILVLLILISPGYIFRNINSGEMDVGINYTTAILTNIEMAENIVNDSILSAHQAIVEEINWDISGLPEGTRAKIEDSFASGSSTTNTNDIIASYCASKDKWDEISISALKNIMDANQDKLFTYTKTMTTEQETENCYNVFIYTISYHGNTYFNELFDIDEEKRNLAHHYAENLKTFLSSTEIIKNTAAVSEEVERYSDTINKYAQRYGICEFVTIIKCMMMAESGGRGTDVMQCSECPYNEKYPKKPNSITDVDYSIEIGIQYFAECAKQAECMSPTDVARLSLALQGYNYGNGYIGWAKEKYGGYSQENAQEFSNIMQTKLGWPSYGNPNYVSAVLKYALTTSTSGGGTGWGSPFPGKDWKSAVTSEFGHRVDPVTGEKGTLHAGIDIGYPTGTLISAVKEGTVEAANYDDTGYGYHIMINHGDGYKTLYGHCSTLLVKAGDRVTKGQAIATVGSTGKSTGPHLHLNVYINGEPKNPRNFINGIDNIQ